MIFCLLVALLVVAVGKPSAQRPRTDAHRRRLRPGAATGPEPGPTRTVTQTPPVAGRRTADGGRRDLPERAPVPSATTPLIHPRPGLKKLRTLEFVSPNASSSGIPITITHRRFLIE